MLKHKTDLIKKMINPIKTMYNYAIYCIHDTIMSLLVRWVAQHQIVQHFQSIITLALYEHKYN